METEKKDRQYADGVQVQVTAVEADMDLKNPMEVKRLSFITNVGKITLKPKVPKTEYREGIKVNVQQAAMLNQLPENVKAISKKVQTNGKCEVKAYYQIWNTEVDGQPVTYRFVQGMNMMAKWGLVEEKAVPVEEVK